MSVFGVELVDPCLGAGHHVMLAWRRGRWC
jgi:hypothetical protein